MPDVAAFLRGKGIALNKNLGQHFLIDDAVLQSIIDAADITPEEDVVEIGAGIGALTAELLKRARHVTAIELDNRLIPILESFVASQKGGGLTENMSIILANALEVPMPQTPYKIVANIPYHITSPLLRHVFLESDLQPTSLTLLIQREVAERICDTENAGMLTILVGLFGTPRIIRTVKPAAFLPPPKVDSAVLHMQSFQTPFAERATIDKIFQLTKIAFSQKRKMLRKSFGAFHGGRELLAAAGIDETRRPQTLSIREWIAIAEHARDAGTP